MATITINGVTYTGNSIIVRNGRAIIDGKDVASDDKAINISVSGNIDKLEVGGCEKLTVTGDVGNVDAQVGDIEIGGSVKGSVATQTGDINVRGSVGGKVSTMVGDISYRK